MEKMYKFSNKEVIQILKEVVAAMEVKGFNFFRIRAFQNAIGAIENMTSSVFDFWQNGRLGEIPGVGEGLSDKLEELFTTGKVVEFSKIKEGLPEGMFSLIGIRSVGAKRAFKLANAFNLKVRDDAVERLRQMAEQGKVQVLDGFGEKSEKELLQAISDAKMTKNEKPRLLLIKAEEIAQRIITYMKELPEVKEVVVLGSYRRRNPTVGDLDVAAVYQNGDAQSAIKHFLKFSEIEEVLAEGDKKASVVLKNELQVDFRVSTPEAFGSMVQYFTGNKQHNVLLRTYSLDKGKSLSEYGIKYHDKLHEFRNETDFYNFIDLPYIEPELRQGKDEIELAIKNKLPTLVQLSDIKGDIHTHTNYSDGLNTINEMVEAAIKRGYKYLGLADHAPSVQSRGLEEVMVIIERTRKQIDKINASQQHIKVLFGYEVNILVDCTLALPDEALSQLDYVVASIHTGFNQDRENMTQRVVKALENPYVTVLGHPGGRLIGERDGIDVNWNTIFKVALENNKILEINGQPNRLDLADDLVKDAQAMGVKLMINSDAHDTSTLNFMKYGVDVARRGFCESSDILNTLDLEDFLTAIDYKKLR